MEGKTAAFMINLCSTLIHLLQSFAEQVSEISNPPSMCLWDLACGPGIRQADVLGWARLGQS